jgi:hypothetical protein
MGARSSMGRRELSPFFEFRLGFLFFCLFLGAESCCWLLSEPEWGVFALFCPKDAAGKMKQPRHKKVQIVRLFLNDIKNSPPDEAALAVPRKMRRHPAASVSRQEQELWVGY